VKCKKFVYDPAATSFIKMQNGCPVPFRLSLNKCCGRKQNNQVKIKWTFFTPKITDKVQLLESF